MSEESLSKFIRQEVTNSTNFLLKKLNTEFAKINQKIEDLNKQLEEVKNQITATPTETGTTPVDYSPFFTNLETQLDLIETGVHKILSQPVPTQTFKPTAAPTPAAAPTPTPRSPSRVMSTASSGISQDIKILNELIAFIADSKQIPRKDIRRRLEVVRDKIIFERTEESPYRVTASRIFREMLGETKTRDPKDLELSAANKKAIESSLEELLGHIHDSK